MRAHVFLQGGHDSPEANQLKDNKGVLNDVHDFGAGRKRPWEAITFGSFNIDCNELPKRRWVQSHA